MNGIPINKDELAICKRRGHSTDAGLTNGWVQCKWCGTWLRDVHSVEEREDEPPEDEKNPLPKLRGRFGIP